MSQKDLLRELKNSIKELTDEKDSLLTQLKSKESRIKQVLVQLEQSVDDVNHCGKKIREQEDLIKELTQEIRDLKKPEDNEETVDSDEQEPQEQTQED